MSVQDTWTKLMNEINQILPYIDQSVAMIFAVLVWLELRTMRKQSIELLIRIDERVSK